MQSRVPPTHIERYLPLSLLTTGLVTVLPVAVLAGRVRSPHPLSLLLVAIAAMAMSIAIASVAAAAWKRCPGSRDVMFADLMLWSWCRRYWSERRLGQARTLYESARQAGPSVSVDLLKRLSTSLEARDAYTQGHSQRVARYAGLIADAMRLPDVERAKIRTAAAVHDVGKIHTPQEILNCPGALSEEQFRILKHHPIDGWEMLAGVGEPDIAVMVRHHHERIDGCGYPDGLAGLDIPLGARIIAVADTFDAITSNRVYRSARTHKKALDMLREQSGSQLDEAAVAAFAQAYTARRPVAWLAFASAVAERLPALLSASSTSVSLGAAGSASLLPALGAAGAVALAHRQSPTKQLVVRSQAHASAATERPTGALLTAAVEPRLLGGASGRAAPMRGVRTGHPRVVRLVPTGLHPSIVTTPNAAVTSPGAARTNAVGSAPVEGSVSVSFGESGSSAPAGSSGASSGPSAPAQPPSDAGSGEDRSPVVGSPPVVGSSPGVGSPPGIGSSPGAGSPPSVQTGSSPASAPTPALEVANVTISAATPTATVQPATVSLQTSVAAVTVTATGASLPAVKLP